MKGFREYGIKMMRRAKALLDVEGFGAFPRTYEEFSRLDFGLRKFIGQQLPLVISDNYEHFMANLPGKKYAAHHVLSRKMIGGFSVASGYWKLLEFLSVPLTEEKVELAADYYAGGHNNNPRPFDKEYWMHVVRDFGGYLPIQIRYLGEGATFTGVPFPVMETYGEKQAVWVNEPAYIQIGHLSHVATIAAQFMEALGNDPSRFIDVGFRALQNIDGSNDALLAMFIGGGLNLTSNDLGAFVNGAPFKSTGTTGHCYYQQFPTLKEALHELLKSPLGPKATVLLDLYSHEHGFKELVNLIKNGDPAPFGERPDSGDTLRLAIHDIGVMREMDKKMVVTLEDGYKPAGTHQAEGTRRRHGIPEKDFKFGAGGAFFAKRSAMETAYKACYFHNGSPENTKDELDTMKICLDDPSKQSLPGRIEWFYNDTTGLYLIGARGEKPPSGYCKVGKILYDGLTKPGEPYFDADYWPWDLANCPAIESGLEDCRNTRNLLGPAITLDFAEGRHDVAITQEIEKKIMKIRENALQAVSGQNRNREDLQ